MNISKAEIIEMENNLLDAIKTSDILFLNKALHNDLLFLAPNGQVITKALDLASHQAGDMVVEKVIPAIENINIIDDTAVVVVVYDTKGTMLGKPIQGYFRYIRIWKQFPDGLKIIGGGCSML